MKTLQTVLIFLTIAFSGFAQGNWFAEGQGFNSVFQNREKGDYMGKVTGTLQLRFEDGEIEYCTFANSYAELSVRPDKNKIYDVSFKNYTFGNNKIKLRYSTYNLANALTVFISDTEYTTTLIDGACELVLSGLEYKYFDEGETELLLLLFSNDVGLSLGSCNVDPQLFIEKGSTLVLSITK
jgi:hypothetical protein